MKFTLLAASVTLLNLAAATPFSSPDDSSSLEGRSYGKCRWKEERCCANPYLDDKDHWWPYGHGHTYKNCRIIHVKKNGKGIQHAIDSASRGDKIVVEAGTYAEQLTIKKDGIQLVGNGAILVPPPKPVKNTCSGLSGPDSQVGICVTGSGVKLAKFVVEHRKVISVQKPVEDVSVIGFKVRGFSGINIAVLGARNTRVFKNELTDGGSYGSLTLGSYNTVVSDNVVTSTSFGFIGICMDNFSGVRVSKNNISLHYIGLCVQTTGADVRFNQVTATCIGVFVDPGVKGAKIRHNHIGPGVPGCGEAGASGIIIDGAIGTKVEDNLIEGQTNDGKAAGIVVIDDPCTGPNLSISCIALGHAATASKNVVIRNTLRNNDFDIFVNTTATNNIITCNTCSTPENLCSK
ncbi:Fc.00g108020.m01.CDS01 [Cosmosporella sp. VM-42]